MKRIPWILILVLVAVLALLLWRSHLAQSTAPDSAIGAASEMSKESAPNQAQTVAASPPPPSEKAVGEPEGKGALISRFLGAVNHKEIKLFGKVVDQAGAPLGGVTVYASAIYNTGLESGLDKAQTTTDSAGLFTIEGMKGRTLGIGLAKSGYEYGGDHGPFQYTELVKEAERYHPDPKNPVLFVMWRLQGAEPMIVFEDRELRVPVDGMPLRIDLTTGKRVETGGDLLITLRHAMAAPGEWLHRYPWQAEVAAPGGLIETTSRLMYLAPESGYVSSLSLSEKGDEPEYRGQFDKQLYIKTEGGNFARLRMHVSTQTNPDRSSYAVLSWWLNPRVGSRNLEYEPTRTAVLPSRIKPVPGGNTDVTPKP